MTAHEHSFSYDNDPRPGQRSMCCSCGTYLFEHAPGHPYGVQAGPAGMFARWCLVDGCGWRETTGSAKQAAEDAEAEREYLDAATDSAWLESREAGYVTTVFLLFTIIAGCLITLAATA